MIKRLLFVLLLNLFGCAHIPDGITAIDGFEINRYLGTWYEIARLDHSFERGLTNVSAIYEMRDDGGITVVNKGLDKNSGKWKQAEGKAYFVSSPDIGRLKVSFFGPFYGGYNIIALDKENYFYSMVCGPTRSYLWILSRKRRLGEKTVNRLGNYARTLGFETNELIFVDHNNE